MFPFPAVACFRGRYTTWNPSDVAGFTLSNANLTVTSTGAVNGNVRATTSRSSGKRAYRATIGGTSNDIYLGFGTATFPVGGGSVIGGALTSAFSYRASTGDVLIAGSSLASWPTAAFGSVVDLVLDIATKAFSLYINGVGISTATITGLDAGPYYPMIGTPSASGRVATAQFYGMPLAAGINSWDEA